MLEIVYLKICSNIGDFNEFISPFNLLRGVCYHLPELSKGQHPECCGREFRPYSNNQGEPRLAEKGLCERLRCTFWKTQNGFMKRDGLEKAILCRKINGDLRDCADLDEDRSDEVEDIKKQQ